MNELSGSPQQAATLLYFLYTLFLFFFLSLYYYYFFLSGWKWIFIFPYALFKLLTVSSRKREIPCLFHMSSHYKHTHSFYKVHWLCARFSRLVNFSKKFFDFDFIFHTKEKRSKYLSSSFSLSPVELCVVRVWIPVKVTSLSGVKANWWKEWRGEQTGFLILHSKNK